MVRIGARTLFLPVGCGIYSATPILCLTGFVTETRSFLMLRTFFLLTFPADLI